MLYQLEYLIAGIVKELNRFYSDFNPLVLCSTWYTALALLSASLMMRIFVSQLLATFCCGQAYTGIIYMRY